MSKRALKVVSKALLELWAMRRPHPVDVAGMNKIFDDLKIEIVKRLVICAADIINDPFGSTSFHLNDEINGVAGNLLKIIGEEVNHYTKNEIGKIEYVAANENDRWKMIDISDFRMREYILAFIEYIEKNTTQVLQGSISFKHSIAFPNK